MGRAGLIIKTVHCRIFQLCHTFNKMLFQLPHAGHLLFKVCIDFLCRKCKPCNARNVFRAGADIFLLLPAKDNGFYLHSF